MATGNKTRKKTLSKSRRKPKAITNIEVFEKILADQKFIRESIQSGMTFQELKDKYGYKFATV